MYLNVIFCSILDTESLNLTLTRVVFELSLGGYDIFDDIRFNFNKSCIWIKALNVIEAQVEGFNFNKSCIWIDIN